LTAVNSLPSPSDTKPNSGGYPPTKADFLSVSPFDCRFVVLRKTRDSLINFDFSRFGMQLALINSTRAAVLNEEFQSIPAIFLKELQRGKQVKAHFTVH
jgi:hypothetical protein